MIVLADRIILCIDSLYLAQHLHKILELKKMAFLQQLFPLFSNFLHEDVHHNLKDVPQEWSIITALKDIGDSVSKNIIIVGPDTADKTSLVFQAAVSAASVGENVTHICTHPLKRLPIPVHGMPSPEPSIMNNIDFLYLEESKELISWLANVHTMSRLPSLIIVEDILTYASQINDSQLERSLARLCATIADSAKWIESHNDIGKCCVILTAPTRALALSHVLLQFPFRIAEYFGPTKSAPVSEFCLKAATSTITIKFKRHKDSLMLIEVTASKSDSSLQT